MNNKYYDVWEFRKAMATWDTNPFETKSKLEEYLKDYPNDYCANAYYAGVLITLSQLDKASEIVDYIEKEAREDFQFQKDKGRCEALKSNIIFDKLRLLLYLEKYEELYDFFLKHRSYINEKFDGNQILFYCASKLGKLDVSKREINSYLFRQIVEYRESDFMSHIKKHMADTNSERDDPNKNIFSTYFPLDEVISEVKKYIPSDKRISTGFIENTYYFKYDKCGRDNNKLVDYFKVVCFHNSANMITACPVHGYQSMPYVDLNYIQENKGSDKKRMSQIDKFNKRYKR